MSEVVTTAGLVVSLGLNVVQVVSQVLSWRAWRRRFSLMLKQPEAKALTDIEQLREQLGREVLEDALRLYRQLKESHEEVHRRLQADNGRLREQILEADCKRHETFATIQQQAQQIAGLERENQALSDAITRQDGEIRRLSNRISVMSAQLAGQSEQVVVQCQQIKDLRLELDMYRTGPEFFTSELREKGG